MTGHSAQPRSSDPVMWLVGLLLRPPAVRVALLYLAVTALFLAVQRYT